MKKLIFLISVAALASAVSGCGWLRAGGESVEAVGDGVGHAVEQTGNAVGRAASQTEREVEEVVD